MRLEKKEQEELAERKGLTGKTLIQAVWLLISFAIAYFLINFLEDEGTFSYSQLYDALSIPREIPQWALQGAMMLIVVIIMQFVIFIAFAFSSPEGRRKSGKASLHSHRKDPFDEGY